MTGRTIAIQNSNEVMAVFGIPGVFYRGEWQDVQVTGVGREEDTPLDVRRSLVGLVIPTIFTKERIEEQTGAKFSIPEGSRLAYASDVAKALKEAGKLDAAKQLERITSSPLDMYVFEKEIYQVAQKVGQN